MISAAGSASGLGRVLKGVRAAALNVALPILLGWILTRTWHRFIYQADVRSTAAEHNSFGQVRLKLELPDTHTGLAEPLIVCGSVGNASLVFIKLLEGGQAKVGIEFWGRELEESDAFDLPASSADVTLTCDVPAFYPPVGSSAWRTIPADLQKIRQTEYLVTVDGVVRLKGAIDYTEPPHAPMYLGANPLGGSFVSSRFTGRILSHSQGF